ncbi:MAG: insulinase family protein, partial [Chloroflexi bacterium]|nr:insulinase family protein [Chloroflexota bacterium]
MAEQTGRFGSARGAVAALRAPAVAFTAVMAAALALTGAIGPAVAQKKVAAPEIATALGNLDAGKPMSLNGIRETILPDGLVVLTREVHTAPVVFFDVYYKVGSVNEQVGQTGMSHLMEHMMFKGTKTRGPGVISSELQDNGAEFNASTWYDRTEYHEALAADRLELAMQIESDRMVNSLYDEAQHQKEMTVVRSEYEAGENRPSTALDKAVRLAAYQVHPYRWTTIGFRSDIENFTRDEMYAYYKNYYTPNNAVAVIVGDFDTAKALDMARKYFGIIKPHPVMEHFITPEPAQEGERRVIVQRAGTVPSIEMVYHIPGFENPDRYPIDVME